MQRCRLCQRTEHCCHSSPRGAALPRELPGGAGMGPGTGVPAATALRLAVPKRAGAVPSARRPLKQQQLLKWMG